VTHYEKEPGSLKQGQGQLHIVGIVVFIVTSRCRQINLTFPHVLFL